MRRLLLGLVLAACGETAPATPADGGALPEGATSDAAPTVEPPLVTTTYTESSDDMPNPERGFVDQVDFAGGGDFSFVRANARTLAYAGVHLEAYRAKDLDAPLLQTVTSGFTRARAAGIKLVLRFVYNDGPGTVVGAPDASLAQIQKHLTQLAPALQANADVLAVMNAGFIGFWGEWHHSGGTDPNNLDNDPAHQAVLHALLAALPASRMVEIRTPMAKGALYGPALTDLEAWNGSEKARVGHHNDCFLSSPDDYGTYASAAWKTYVATETRFVPQGGETCSVDAPRSDCPSSLSEMALLHTSHLNALYDPSVLAGWQTQGCMPEVRRKLGYRLSLVSVAASERVRPGGILQLRITLRNGGWASLYNARPVYVTLDDARASIAVDPRTWAAGADATFTVRLRIPSTTTPGAHRLALWLPDDAAALQTRPEYSIQLANAGVWDATRGDNALPILAIDASAPGETDPSATVFAAVP